MTSVTMVLVVVGVIGFLTFMAKLAETIGPNPLVVDERRMAYPDPELRRRKRELAGVVIGVLVVIFAAALVIPQGGPTS